MQEHRAPRARTVTQWPFPPLPAQVPARPLRDHTAHLEALIPLARHAPSVTTAQVVPRWQLNALLARIPQVVHRCARPALQPLATRALRAALAAMAPCALRASSAPAAPQRPWPATRAAAALAVHPRVLLANQATRALLFQRRASPLPHFALRASTMTPPPRPAPSAPLGSIPPPRVKRAVLPAPLAPTAWRARHCACRALPATTKAPRASPPVLLAPPVPTRPQVPHNAPRALRERTRLSALAPQRAPRAPPARTAAAPGSRPSLARVPAAPTRPRAPRSARPS